MKLKVNLELKNPSLVLDLISTLRFLVELGSANLKIRDTKTLKFGNFK